LEFVFDGGKFEMQFDRFQSKNFQIKKNYTSKNKILWTKIKFYKSALK